MPAFRASPVYALFKEHVQCRPHEIAIIGAESQLTYAQLFKRAEQCASLLVSLGVQRGDRISVLSENRPESFEVELAAAKLGIIVAFQNWRLSPHELDHCLQLVQPKVLFLSKAQADLIAGVSRTWHAQIVFDGDYNERLARVDGTTPDAGVEDDDGLTILYTSGTTGFPKAATISQGALVARMHVFLSDLGIRREDAFLAWAPMFHMASNDHALATLMSGSTVIVENGFDKSRIVDILARHRIGWLVLIPGVIEPLISELKATGTRPIGIKAAGAMPDLVPPKLLAEATALLGAPYLNSFGSTETGLPPLSGSVLAAGEVPASLAKRPSSSCDIKLVSADWDEVPRGEPGEVAVRGPTLFNGYWTPTGYDRSSFSSDGFFHLGDIFRQRADGTYDFMDRAKYMIKSGGENIYPAEIERILLAIPHVLEACVVKKPDARWGEVPIAFVAVDGAAIDESHFMKICKSNLARYKCPQRIMTVDIDAFPRNITGKILRRLVEAWALDIPEVSARN